MNEKFNELFMINLNTFQCKILIPRGVYPFGRTYHSMVNLKNFIYIFGGISQEYLHEVYKINIEYIVGNEENVSTNNEVKKFLKNEKNQNFENIDEMKKEIVSLNKTVSELLTKYEKELQKNTCKVT